MKPTTSVESQARLNSLVRSDYYALGEAECGMDAGALGQRLREKFIGRMAVAVVDTTSSYAKAILDTLFSEGVLRGDDRLTLVQTRSHGPNNERFAFGDYLLASENRASARILAWGESVDQQYLRTRTYDCVVFPAQSPREAGLFRVLARYSSLALIGAVSTHSLSQRRAWKKIAVPIDRNDDRPIFNITPSSGHCVPLALDGSDENADEYLRLTAACDNHRRSSCSSVDCPAALVQGLGRDAETTV